MLTKSDFFKGQSVEERDKRGKETRQARRAFRMVPHSKIMRGRRTLFAVGALLARSHCALALSLFFSLSLPAELERWPGLQRLVPVSASCIYRLCYNSYRFRSMCLAVGSSCGSIKIIELKLINCHTVASHII